MSLSIKITSVGGCREGVSQKGRPYIMGEAYAHLTDIPYPQQISYYCDSKQDVLPVGEYEVPLLVSVRDQRLDFRLDTKNARRVSTPTTAVKPPITDK